MSLPASFNSVPSSMHASMKSERTKFLFFGLYICVRTTKEKGRIVYMSVL